ncbi:hypothetical protein YWY31_57100 [Paenibacillus illinoisensis]
MVLRSLLYRRKEFYEKPEPSLERAFLEGGREACLAFCYSTKYVIEYAEI